MLRWMMPFLIAVLAIPSTAEAAGPTGKAAARRAASQLPPGLPRANYKFRTTIARPAPTPYVRAVYVADEPDVLVTPWNGYVPYVLPAVGVAWSPGYPAWSGNWGLPLDYDYQGPWYAGAEIGYWNRQPYGYGWGLNGYGYY